MSKHHKLSRELEGWAVMFPLPLCWDAEGKQRGAEDADWWTSWDHEVIDPTRLMFATEPGAVTCSDCLEWMHA